MPAGAVGLRRLPRPIGLPATVAVGIVAVAGGVGQRPPQLLPGQSAAAAAGASDGAGADWIGFRRSLEVVFSVDYLELRIGRKAMGRIVRLVVG